jgi:hypothetical protein
MWKGFYPKQKDDGNCISMKLSYRVTSGCFEPLRAIYRYDRGTMNGSSWSRPASNQFEPRQLTSSAGSCRPVQAGSNESFVCDIVTDPHANNDVLPTAAAAASTWWNDTLRTLTQKPTTFTVVLKRSLPTAVQSVSWVGRLMSQGQHVANPPQPHPHFSRSRFDELWPFAIILVFAAAGQFRLWLHADRHGYLGSNDVRRAANFEHVIPQLWSLSGQSAAADKPTSR